MLEALYQIGKIQPKSSFLDEFIEDLGKNQKYIFKIVFDISDKENIFYKGIDYEEYDENKKLSYFYKRGSANGTDKTPLSKFAGDITKTFNKKILKSLDSFIKNNKNNIDNENKIFLDKLNNNFKENRYKIEYELYKFLIANAFTKNKNEISKFFTEVSIYEKSGDKSLDFKLNKRIDKIEDKVNSLDIDKRYKLKIETFKNIKGKDEITILDGGVLSITFIENGKEKYIGDLEQFKDIFLNSKKDAYKSYYELNGKVSFQKDKYCYICKRNNNEVMGFVSTFKFYTVDKKGMVTGGFKQEDAWKNYPVCLNCAITLDKGKKYTENNMKYKFCGFSYMLIPQLILNDDDKLSETIKRIKNKYNEFSLTEKKSDSIERLEEKTLKMLSKTENNILFNFMFYEIKSAAFRILLQLNEVAPTRLSSLIDTKRKVDNEDNKKYKLFEPIPVKKGKEFIYLDFSFSFIRDFFSNSKIYGNYDKDFLGILNNIFINNKISYKLLLKRFINRVRPDFLENNMIDFWILKAYKIILYIEEIKQLNRNYYTMEGKAMYRDDFFKENIIFDDYTKRAVFLEGVLADFLLSIQYQERNAKPFQARLNGLKIDEKIAKRLLPEMINKLEEYKKNYYRDLESGISEYMLKSNFKKYSVDELSFYFTLGMTLSKHFKNEKEESLEIEDK